MHGDGDARFHALDDLDGRASIDGIETADGNQQHIDVLQSIHARNMAQIPQMRHRKPFALEHKDQVFAALGAALIVVISAARGDADAANLPFAFGGKHARASDTRGVVMVKMLVALGDHVCARGLLRIANAAGIGHDGQSGHFQGKRRVSIKCDLHPDSSLSIC